VAFSGDEPLVESRRQNERETELLLSLVPYPTTIIDVGSNVGGFAQPFIERGDTVISIEPLARNVADQAKRFSRHVSARKLLLLQAACSDKKGTATLFVSDDASGSFSSLEQRWTKAVFKGCCSGTHETVATLRLCDVIREHSALGPIGVVKIDTEGHEEAVLRGLFAELSGDSRPQFVMFEFNTKDINIPYLQRSLGVLRRHGYADVKYFVRHGSILLFESGWLTDDPDITQWDGPQGVVPAHFRYGNVIARLAS